MAHPSNKFKSFQEYLDTGQYKLSGILRYEFIFGKGYVSPGGEETSAGFVQEMDLKPGNLVLDVGCGVGGPAFHMARKGLRVHGVDLSTNMLSIMDKYHKELELEVRNRISFEIGDVMEMDFEVSKFDAIHSRDVLVHIPEKKKLFQRFFKWLKPGGRLLITVYTQGKVETPDFDEYVSSRGYHMSTLEEYASNLTHVGFSAISARNEAEELALIMARELYDLQGQKRSEFVQKFGLDNYEYIVRNWRSKMEWCSGGALVWGVYTARKD